MSMFEPRQDPARSIYLALLAEADHSRSRSVEEWTRAEREAVHHESVRQAGLLGLRAPTMEEIEAAERSACGHVDYAAKWAYGVAAVMTKENQTDD